MKVWDNRKDGGRGCCFQCGHNVLVAVEMRHNANRDQPAAFQYLCLDCIAEAALEADTVHGDPESDGSDG